MSFTGLCTENSINEVAVDANCMHVFYEQIKPEMLTPEHTGVLHLLLKCLIRSLNKFISSLPAGRFAAPPLTSAWTPSVGGENTELKPEKGDKCQNKETLVQLKDSKSIKPVRSDFPGGVQRGKANTNKYNIILNNHPSPCDDGLWGPIGARSVRTWTSIGHWDWWVWEVRKPLVMAGINHLVSTQTNGPERFLHFPSSTKHQMTRFLTAEQSHALRKTSSPSGASRDAPPKISNSIKHSVSLNSCFCKCIFMEGKSLWRYLKPQRASVLARCERH